MQFVNCRPFGIHSDLVRTYARFATIGMQAKSEFGLHVVRTQHASCLYIVCVNTVKCAYPSCTHVSVCLQTVRAIANGAFNVCIYQAQAGADGPRLLHPPAPVLRGNPPPNRLFPPGT